MAKRRGTRRDPALVVAPGGPRPFDLHASQLYPIAGMPPQTRHGIRALWDRAGDFEPGFMMKLAQKDCRLALAMVESLGIAAPVGRAALASVDEAVRQGMAERDVGALLKLREEGAGVEVRL